MKHALLLALSIALIFSSCGKSNEEPSVEGKTCQIATVAYEILKYDSQGRITNISTSNDQTGTNITYEGNLIKILGSSKRPDIKFTMAGGRVISGTEVTNSGSITEYSFSYNLDGYLTKIVSLYGGETHTWDYSYTDGNLTKDQFTLLSRGKTTVNPPTLIEYSTELASNIADIGVPIERHYVYNLYKLDNYFGKQSKNLVSKMTTESGTVLTYTYSKDANGNITSVKRSGLDPYLIKYTCK